MRRWRTVIGTFLVALPLLIVLAMLLSGVLLGSLGVDIHWSGSKEHFYVAMLFAGLTLLACFFIGFRLRRKERHDVG